MPGIFSELVQRTVDPSTIPVQINRLVDLAVTVRYRCGKAQFRAVAVPDPEFDAADFETKLRMVKYLQDLRLLLWLLSRKEYVVSRDHVFHYLPQSSLIPDANLCSTWTFWRTINHLSIDIGAPRSLLEKEEQYQKYVVAQCKKIPRKRLILEQRHAIAYWLSLCFDCTIGAAMRLADLFSTRQTTTHWLIQPSRLCGEIEESCLLVCHFYLPMERADTIDTKILSARCPLANIHSSIYGTPPLYHLGLSQP